MEKVNFLYLRSQLPLLLLVFLLTFSTNIYSQDESADSGGDVAAGEALFKSNCAACHKMDSKAVGPALRGVADKFEKDWLHNWIRNSQAMVVAGDPLAVKLFEENNKMIMTPFPALSDADIDNILAYTSKPKTQPPAGIAGADGVAAAGDGGSVSNDLVLGALALIFILLVIMLFLVFNTQRRIAEANGVDTTSSDEKKVPLWKAFAQNQFLVIVVSIFFIIAGSYFGFGYLMQVGVDQGYQPVQPIHYSHKIHAGDNQID